MKIRSVSQQEPSFRKTPFTMKGYYFLQISIKVPMVCYQMSCMNRCQERSRIERLPIVFQSLMNAQLSSKTSLLGGIIFVKSVKGFFTWG